MNTMLPFPSFAECARVHPTRALHRQIIEADDCLRHLLQDPAKPPRRKQPHPCVEMWGGKEDQLQEYLTAFIHEWMERNLVAPPVIDMVRGSRFCPEFRMALPSDDLHRTYREHLLAKYGADSTQPDQHFIHASRDWTESPVLHKPFPFPKETTTP